LSDEINGRIIQSEIEGGVYLRDLPRATVLRVQTQHREYTVVFCGHGQVLISGHPEFCPEPVLVTIDGSTWGGSMLKQRFIGRGMQLEFRHPEYPTPIITSPVQEISSVNLTASPARASQEDEMESFPTGMGPASA
jgi:hypothetical protein